MTTAQRLLIEMKARAGLATPDEMRALANTWLLVGGTDGGCPLAVPPPARSAEEWLARHADASYTPAAGPTPERNTP